MLPEVTCQCGWQCRGTLEDVSPAGGAFAIGAYKAYGRRGLAAMLPVIAVCGALVPGLSPLMLGRFIRQDIGIVVPAQMFFGPVAFAAYLWLRRQGPERTAGEWFRQQDEAGRVPLRATRRARPSPEPVA